MKKLLLLITLSLLTAGSLHAQTALQKQNLLDFAKQQSAEWKAKKELAVKIATEKGYPLTVQFDDNSFAELQEIRNGMPLYFITMNSNAALTLSNDKVWPGGSTGYNLTGNGVTLGEWDGGGVLTTHQELTGRVTQGDSPSSTNSHSTHVAGTMIATGVTAAAKGMAYQANLRAFDWDSDISEMTTEAVAGMKASNHSYGYLVGWRYNYLGDSKWVWFGDASISETEDYSLGFYSDYAQSCDNLAYNAPNYLICKAAGNDRNEGPGASVTHWYYNSGWVSSTTFRENDGGTYGYDCIEGGGIAKNVLTVGAVLDIPAGYTQSSDVQMTSFSCWGPTDDGRIKPDICGNGYGLYSTNNTGSTDYTTMSGTSMATPNVTGSIGLLLHHLALNCGGGTRTAATIKGLIIHTADEAGSYTGPDYSYGWGLMNTKKATQLMSQNYQHATPFEIQETTLNNGATNSIQVYSDGLSPIRVTICWTDKAGTPPSPALDPSDKMLVNDLDLRLIRNSTNYYPYTLDRNNPANAARSDQDNSVDNVEQVYIASPTAGVYTVRVTHKNTLSSPAYQNYSLIMSGVTELIPPALTSPTNNLFVAPLSGTFNWTAVARTVDYRIQYSTDQTFATNTEYTTNTTSQNFSGLDYNTKYYWRVRSENTLTTGPWSEVWNFTTMLAPPTLVSPADLQKAVTVAGNLSWNTVTGATSYAAQIATDEDFNSVVVTKTGVTATQTTYTGLDNNTVYYWRVRATDSHGNSEWSTVRSFTTMIAPPVLGTPANGANDITMPGTFTWFAANNADSYDLQVSDNVNFTPPIIDATALEQLSYEFSGLGLNQTYYWRVRSSNTDGKSVWSGVWSFTTTLPAPVLVAPSNYSEEIKAPVSFEWNSVANAEFYNLQISASSDFSTLLVDAKGITGLFRNFTSLKLSPYTTYYWRVQAATSEYTGKWSAARQFRSYMAAPVLLSPTDGSSGAAVNADLSWNASKGADFYDLQVSTDPSFATTLFNKTLIVKETYDVHNLSFYTKYYWRVRAKRIPEVDKQKMAMLKYDPDTVISDWSETWSFTTTLPKPALTLPVNDASGQPLSVGFKWLNLGTGVKYYIQIAADQAFGNILKETELTENTFEYSGFNQTTKYYWRIYAIYPGDVHTVWSDTWSFTTKLLIDKPILAEPTDYFFGAALAGTLKWKPVDNADKYQVQVSKKSDFAATVSDQSNIAATEFNYSGLENGITYFWRVRASNSSITGEWSNTWRYTTKHKAPDADDETNPDTDSASVNASTLNGLLIWHKVPKAIYYNLQIANVQDFSVRTFDSTHILDTFYIYRNLSHNSTYYWRVQAVFEEETGEITIGEWTTGLYFKTKLAAPANYISPVHQAVEVEPTTGSISWEKVTGAEYYVMELAFDPAVTNIDKVSGNLAQNVYNYTDLAEYTDYYWHVKAGNTDGESDWSSVWQFKTRLVTSADDEVLVPGLLSIAPNPVNSTAMIALDLASGSEINIGIYDLLGTKVAEPASGRFEPGRYSFIWDCGKAVSSGTYLIRFTIDGCIYTKMISVVR